MTQSKKPTHGAFQVKELGNKNTHWTRIGAAWAHQDGKGYNIELDALPVDGKIVLREAKDEKHDK